MYRFLVRRFSAPPATPAHAACASAHGRVDIDQLLKLKLLIVKLNFTIDALEGVIAKHVEISMHRRALADKVEQVMSLLMKRAYAMMIPLNEAGQMMISYESTIDRDEKRNRDRVEILQDIRAIRREVVEMIRRIEKSQDY